MASNQTTGKGIHTREIPHGKEHNNQSIQQGLHEMDNGTKKVRIGKEGNGITCFKGLLQPNLRAQILPFYKNDAKESIDLYTKTLIFNMAKIGIASSFDVQVMRTTPTLTDWAITIVFFAIIASIIYFTIRYAYRKIKNRGGNEWKTE